MLRLNQALRYNLSIYLKGQFWVKMTQPLFLCTSFTITLPHICGRIFCCPVQPVPLQMGRGPARQVSNFILWLIMICLALWPGSTQHVDVSAPCAQKILELFVNCAFIQSLGNAPGLYEKAVVDFSVKNQLRWRNNLGM